MRPFRPKPFKAIFCVMLSPVFSLKLKLIPVAAKNLLRHAVLPTTLNENFIIYAFHSLSPTFLLSLQQDIGRLNNLKNKNQIYEQN